MNVPGPKQESEPTADEELNLSLEDTISQKMRGVAAKRSGVSGYNPYDAEPTAGAPRPDGKRKRTDLRKLSEWIRLRREVERLNPDVPRKKPP
jgi:hypothetical protein